MAGRARVLVLGDVMLDQYIWGRVTRISPEAPVPVLEYDRESVMPGGAANVARNLTALGAQVELAGLVGNDEIATRLKALLRQCRVGCDGLLVEDGRPTSVKTRIIAHQQQVVRVDRESCRPLGAEVESRFERRVMRRLRGVDAVVVGDYGKGVVTQRLIEALKAACRSRGIWLSLDPKPVHALRLEGLSLITPNRKEAFELAGMADGPRGPDPGRDEGLLGVADKLLGQLHPALLLITLGDQGMLLCERGRPPFHIPTAAREIYDVSGAGDTVIASFTLAILAGAEPVEAAAFSNQAAGVVVGKVGTATVSPDELLASMRL